MSLIIKQINNRVYKNNQHFMGVITGGTGSGKTYSGLKLCEDLDETFTADRVVFTYKEFIELINSDKLKKGSAILYDEAGVSNNSRRYYTDENINLSFIMQTVRSRNYVIILTTPSIKFIDSTTRALVHYLFETVYIDYSKAAVVTKPLKVVLQQRKDAVFYKYPKYLDYRTRRIQKITRFAIGMPSKSVIDDYEKKKYDYQTKLYNEIKEEMKLKEAEQQKRKEKAGLDKQELIENVKKNINHFINKTQTGIDKYKIMNEYKVGRSIAEQIQKAVEAEDLI